MQKPLRILIAEDEYLCLMGLKSTLEQLGHKVVAEADNGLAAYELTLEKKPDLIFMDISMPIMDGLAAIKKIGEHMLVPSIIVSGYHDDSLIKQAAEIDVLYYLIKPIDIKNVKVALNITLARFEEFKRLKHELKDTKMALEARKHIEKAKGIIMLRKNLTEVDALKYLQKMSRDKNKKIAEISKEIIRANELFVEL